MLIFTNHPSIHISKFSRLIFFVVIFLTAKTYPVFCEEGQLDARKELTDKQYKDHINEFQRAFGKQMESEFGLRLVRPDFPSEIPEFYAYRRATLEEARALALGVILQLSEAVQADPIMVSYFSKPSSSLDFLRIYISFQHTGYHDGSIENVYSYYSMDNPTRVKMLCLEYDVTDPFGDISDNESTSSFRIKESFEDAVKFNAENPIINPAVHNSTEFEDVLNKILSSFKQKMHNEHDLSSLSIGWMNQGCSTSEISEIRAKCSYHHPVDCQEARALMVQTTEKLLIALNNNEILKPYLREYPFSEKAIKLRMLFRKGEYYERDVPYDNGSLESAVLNNETITYFHRVPNAIRSRVHDRVLYAKESYKEAQKAFENAPPPSLWKIVTEKIDYFIDSVIFYYSLLVFTFVVCLFNLTELILNHIIISIFITISIVMLFIFLRKRRRSQRE